MPSTSPPIGPDTPAGPPLPDESALERLFRARYAGLVAAAKTHLKDAQSAAPRVVEALFLRAWDERDQFKTVQDLDAFLKDEVAHASARELARRASAHHFGAGRGGQAKSHAEAAADVNQSWERMQHTLHPDRAAAAVAVKAASRHEAAAHVKGLAKKRNWVVPIVIIAVAIAAALGIAKYLNLLGKEGGVVAALHANEKKATQTRDGQIANINLNDGSTVRVGPGSKFIVADKFGDDMRVVSIEGIAAVTVAPGHLAPLEVRAYNAVIDAPSGGILVRTSDSDSSVVVIAQDATDSVRVGKVNHALAAGAAMHVMQDGQVRDATPVEIADASAWTTDSLSVTDHSLKQVLDDIRQWYGTKILILDKPLLDRMVTFKAPLNSAMAAIAAVEKAGSVKFGYEGQAMVFRDAAKK